MGRTAAPPPPAHSAMSLLSAAIEGHPILSCAAAGVVSVYIFLKIKSKTGKKPGKWRSPCATDIVPYRKGDPVWTVDPKGIGTVRVAATGIASLQPKTLNDLFAAAKALFPDKPAMKVEREGAWVTYTWSEYYSGSERVAKSLIALGLAPHDCVNIIGFNSPEWFMAQMGAILMGGKAAGVYTTNEAEACKYVAEHSEARVVFVEDAKQLTKYLSFCSDLPALKKLVMWTGSVPAAQASQYSLDWASYLALGVDVSSSAVAERSRQVLPGHCATLIYTSGTTGNPKAVMISHDNMIYESIVSMDGAPSRQLNRRRSPPPPLPSHPIPHLLSRFVGPYGYDFI